MVGEKLMICEKILGKLEDIELQGKKLEFITVEWHEAFKKIHRKVTDAGREIGIRLDDSVLKTGLLEGDVLYADPELVIAVHTPPCEVVKARVSPHHPEMIPKVCYEIGNRHAPLFFGEDSSTFVTPYNEPMLRLLSSLHGVEARKTIESLNFKGQISPQIGHSHHHDHGNREGAQT